MSVKQKERLLLRNSQCQFGEVRELLCPSHFGDDFLVLLVSFNFQIWAFLSPLSPSFTESQNHRM